MARPSKRTPETEKKIIDLLGAGNTRRTAAIASGISEDTFGRWMDNADFADAIKKAEETAVARNVALIQKAASTTWQAAAWWLERRRNADYGQRQRIDVTKLSDEQVIALLEGEADAGSE